jgi:hypothetical protein
MLELVVTVPLLPQQLRLHHLAVLVQEEIDVVHLVRLQPPVSDAQKIVAPE